MHSDFEFDRLHGMIAPSICIICSGAMCCIDEVRSCAARFLTAGFGLLIIHR